jgi:hypothetical protein
MASSRGDRNCVEVLLNHGVDITLKNDIPPDNINARQAAVQSGDIGCLEILFHKVSGILKKLKPTMDFRSENQTRALRRLGSAVQTGSSPRPIPPEELKPTEDFALQCEIKIKTDAID